MDENLNKPYTIEYYYKVKWGYADEFLKLYLKNHQPVLEKQKELGRILNISISKPKFHSTEDGRWDFRVVIVWNNISVTDDGFDEKELAKQLYPDFLLHEKEEQRRFELLLAHWDVPVVEINTGK
jgi:hypothetical protein